MRITSALTTVVGTPWRELVFLELETDTGRLGTSEVRMVSRTETLVACLAELAPTVAAAEVDLTMANLQLAVATPNYINHDACAAHPPTGGRIKLFNPVWEQR